MKATTAIPVVILIFQLTNLEPADGFMNKLFNLIKRESQCQSDFKKISNKLVTLTPTSKPAENFASLQDWAVRLRNKGGDSNLIQSIDLLLPLEAYLFRPQDYCGRDGMTLLSQNLDCLTKDVLAPRDQLGQLNRIEDVLNSLVQIYATNCMPVYPSHFKSRISESAETPDFPHNAMGNLARFWNSVFSKSETRLIRPDTVTDKSLLIMKAHGLDLYNPQVAERIMDFVYDIGGPNARSALKIKTVNNGDGFRIDQQAIERVLDESFYKKCRFAILEYGDIFEPVIWGQRVLDQEYYRAVSDERCEFLLWLNYYQQCQMILDPKIKAHIQREIVDLIWEKAELGHQGA